MSTDISLLLEYRGSHGWEPALHLADRVKEPRTHLGILNVCWWSVRSRPTSLFFGDAALLPFNAGLPSDLSQRMREFVLPNFQSNQRYAGWALLPDLDLPSWHRETVIVGGPVQAQYASLFGDGKQPPPIDALLKHGIEEPVLERVTGWKSERKLEVQMIPSHKLQQVSPDFSVQVTWVETLAVFVGRVWNEGLAGIADIESPDLYRIVTSVG